MSDQTVRFQVDCQEMPGETMAELFALKGSIGWFMFAEKPQSEMDLSDVPDIKLERWEKSPSQRLRAVIYRLWESVKSELEFEVYYRSKMDSIIEMLKDKLT